MPKTRLPLHSSFRSTSGNDCRKSYVLISLRAQYINAYGWWVQLISFISKRRALTMIMYGESRGRKKINNRQTASIARSL